MPNLQWETNKSSKIPLILQLRHHVHPVRIHCMAIFFRTMIGLSGAGHIPKFGTQGLQFVLIPNLGVGVQILGKTNFLCRRKNTLAGWSQTCLIKLKLSVITCIFLLHHFLLVLLNNTEMVTSYMLNVYVSEVFGYVYN